MTGIEGGLPIHWVIDIVQKSRHWIIVQHTSTVHLLRQLCMCIWWLAMVLNCVFVFIAAVTLYRKPKLYTSLQIQLLYYFVAYLMPVLKSDSSEPSAMLINVLITVLDMGNIIFFLVVILFPRKDRSAKWSEKDAETVSV